jgi:hypothetical protein
VGSVAFALWLIGAVIGVLRAARLMPAHEVSRGAGPIQPHGAVDA